jgi:hypothetical protein
MAKGSEVLEMLLPDGGWAITGDDYSGIQFIECEPITEKEFKDGFEKVDAYKAKKEADAATAKAALLTKLGITADEAALLLA